MKKQNGITLIALVISIIVMLILAGVSINAIVGENGVLSRAQYSSFMNEMAAVEEAVQLWKAGELIESKGQTSTAIPANGLWEKENVIDANIPKETKRLIGEMGYYRKWSQGEMPLNNILSTDDSLYSAYVDNFVGYPAGVQDVYYLDNEALNLDENKKYLIDAATSMVYSTTGIMVNGVRCYSTYMAKAAMGNNIEPVFIAAEMSGGGNNIIYAGETYLKDKNGNYIDENGNIVSEENKVINPNGFQIIANPSSHNIFKLYNNGDLYGKGVKGTQLNTPVEEMEKINSYEWNKLSILANIPNIKKIITSGNGLMILDSNDDLWAIGNNDYNKFGLTDEQQKEYTGRELIKIELNGKKVKRVFAQNAATFLVTTDNKLYAAGHNIYGKLGLGDTHTTTVFEEVPQITNVENISAIYGSHSNWRGTVIRYNDNTFYYAGTNSWGELGIGSSGQKYYTFTRIYDGIIGPDIDQDIKELNHTTTSYMLKNDGTVMIAGYQVGTSFIEINDLPKIDAMIAGGPTIFLTNNNGVKEVYGYLNSESNTLGIDNYNNVKTAIKLELPSELIEAGVKEIASVSGAYYILGNDGKLYGGGSKVRLGINSSSGYTNSTEYLGIDNVESLSSDAIIECNKLNTTTNILLKKEDGFYMTESANVMFGNDVLQKTWSQIAQNVKHFDASSNVYVDRDGYLWAAGDSRTLGLGEMSQTFTNIPNYIKIDDSNINGKVEKAWNVSGVSYVLLNNKELWGTGLYQENNTVYYPGWSENENKVNWVKILENVEFFTAQGYTIRFAIDSDGLCWTWGSGTSGGLGNGWSNKIVPSSYNLLEEINGVNNILDLRADCSWETSIVTKSGEIYRTGKNNMYYYYGAEDGTRNGGNTKLTKFTSSGITLSENEYFMKFLFDGENAYALTNKKRVFGYGKASRLGIGSYSEQLTSTRELTGVNNVVQLVQGRGWTIAIKSDGTVWGTGTNTYGILGRWIGIDRNSPNSRYKTAFEWVECPELEI